MNNTTTSNCEYQDWYIEQGKIIDFIVFRVISPIYCLISFFGHLFCLIAFYKQTKKEKAYFYQLFSTVSELLTVVFESAFVFTTCWFYGVSAASPAPAIWYRKCYICVWWSAHLALLFRQAFVTLSELAAVCMSADRLFALWRPFVYKNLNMKRHRAVAVGCSIAITVACSCYHYFRCTTESYTENGMVLYKIATPQFTSSLAGKALNHLQNIVRAFSLGALCFCNAGLVYLYRGHKDKNITSMNKKDKKRQETERQLTLLTVGQCSCITISMSLLFAYYTNAFLDPTFLTCKAPVWLPLSSVGIQLMGLSDTLLVIIVSKKVRQLVRDTFWCRKNNAVTEMALSQMHTTL